MVTTIILSISKDIYAATLPDRYVKPVGVENLFGPASLHLIDYTAYRDSLRENVKTRTKAYLGRK